MQRNQQKALTLKYSCSRALSAVILFLGSYVRNLQIQKTTLTAVTCILSIHSLTSPGSGSPLAFYHLSFFPVKQPGLRDPFGPRNYILKSKRRSYLTNQFVLTAFLACERFSFFRRLQNSPYFCVFKYARAVEQKVWNESENRERDWGETP